MNKTIFLIDDNNTNLTVAEEALQEHYRVIALPSAERMFSALEKIHPDLILLDIEMPDMSGFEAMKLLQEDVKYSSIPVIFLTARTDADSEARGIDMGAVDFITKPFSQSVLLNRIKHHLHIDELIRERTRHLELLYNSIVQIMADLVESHDKNTGKHIERTSEYMKIILNAMLKKDVYADEIGTWDLDSVIKPVRLHDAGKVAVPGEIFNKSGLLKSEADMPLQGRIMAIIDVYDALVSERPHKKAFTHDEAIELIEKEAGEHFDPDIVEVFIAVKEQIKAVSDKG